MCFSCSTSSLPKWTYTLSQNNQLVPLSGHSFKPLRQEIPQYYSLTGNLYYECGSISKIFRNGSTFGTPSFAYVMPSEVSIDIDTENDWFIAEQLMRKTIS